MGQDYDIDAWEIYDKLDAIRKDEVYTTLRSESVTLPDDVKRWVDVVGQYSLHNEYPATMGYFVTIGQILKDSVRIPIGRLALDPRIHFCWIQSARSGKTTMFDFLMPVWNRLFELTNTHPTRLREPRLPLRGVKEFNLQNPDSFTDQALLGTLKVNQPNPDYDRGQANEEDYNIPEVTDIPIYGSLFGSGIIAFDEFEHSGIFKESQHKSETVMLFQKFMNRLDSDTHLIKKRLTEWGKDLIVDSQRSLWATTLPPEGLERVILTKGVFQRMWLYVREVPESLKQKMEEEYISNIGMIIDGDENANSQYTEEFAEMLYSTYRWVQNRLEQVNGDRRKVVVWSPDAQKKLMVVHRGMRKYMEGIEDQVFEALNTFLMNIINNISIAAALCAISERTHIIQPRHIDMGRQLTDASFDSITTWFSDKLKASPKRRISNQTESIYRTVYNSCKKVRIDGENGWVLKTTLVHSYAKHLGCATSKFYRTWPDVKHLFDEKRNKKSYVKLREQNE